MKLGISHLFIDVWAVVLTVVCLKKILNIKVFLSLVINVIWTALGMPLSMLIMRVPLQLLSKNTRLRYTT